jgi:hypothetical protein
MFLIFLFILVWMRCTSQGAGVLFVVSVMKVIVVGIDIGVHDKVLLGPS